MKQLTKLIKHEQRTSELKQAVIKEVLELLSDAYPVPKPRVSDKPVEGCVFLHTARFKDIESNWCAEDLQSGLLTEQTKQNFGQRENLISRLNNAHNLLETLKDISENKHKTELNWREIPRGYGREMFKQTASQAQLLRPNTQVREIIKNYLKD